MKSNSTLFQSVNSKHPKSENISEEMSQTRSNRSQSSSNISTSHSNNNLNKSQNETNYNLSDILMKKVGPTHSVGYLGSAILTKGKTGLGCLQQPLRELYCIFRQSGSRLVQERRLIVSLDGVTMLYNELGAEKFIHNDLSSVYEVQLLNLVSQVRKDKKVYFAFLPDEQEPDICYSNLFHQFDKQNAKYLENIVHPPIIALIMRRSTGIQALECHVFITRTMQDAQQIAAEIKNVCNDYKNGINNHSNVFQYKPYNDNLNGENQEIKDVKSSKFLNKLPPKSPFMKNTPKKEKSKIKTDEIYDAFGDNAQISKFNHENDIKFTSKSRESSPVKPSSSIFNKIKSNLKDKSTTSTGNVSNLAEDSKSQKKIKNKNKKALSSTSEVLFSSNNNDSSKLKKSSAETEMQKSAINVSEKRPASAMGNLIRNENQQNKNNESLKQASFTSIALSEDGLSIKSGPGSKKEKKLSLGKRLILSARSSLKSNSSVNSKPNKNSKNLKSNSAASINTVTSVKSKKDFEKIKDVDFRKSKTSIFDDNLLIDSSVFSPVTIIQPSSNISTKIDNRLRSQTPSSICLENRINLISPSSKSIQSTSVNDANFLLKSRSSLTPVHNQLQMPSSNRMNNQQVYYQQRTPSSSSRNTRETINLENNLNDSIHIENKIIGHDSRFQKRIFKYPIADPKMLSNHLVWNQAIGSAECVERKEVRSIKAENFNPIARVLSPGGFDISYRNETNNINRNGVSVNENRNMIRSKSHTVEYSELNPKNNLNLNNMLRDEPVIRFKPHPPSSIIPDLKTYSKNQSELNSSLNSFNKYSTESSAVITNQSKSFGQSSKFHDSAYNTNSSNEGSDFEKVVSYKSAFTARDRSNDSCRREAEKIEQNTSVINRVNKMQEEELERKRTKTTLTSHKIIGGVKVFPSLPHEYRHASELRQKRFAEIEKNINNNSKIEFQIKQKCNLNELNVTELKTNENDHEIIDLTNTKESRNDNYKSTSYKEIPIEILPKKIEPIEQVNKTIKASSENLRAKPLLSADEMLYCRNNDSLENSNNSSLGQPSINEPDQNDKSNYIYYYDNDHFGGY